MGHWPKLINPNPQTSATYGRVQNVVLQAELHSDTGRARAGYIAPPGPNRNSRRLRP
jgi:hypothetical protein